MSAWSGQRRSHLSRYWGDGVAETVTATRRLHWEERTHYFIRVTGSVTFNLPTNVRNETTGLKLTIWNDPTSTTSITVAGTSIPAGSSALVFLIDTSTAAGTYRVWVRTAGARTVLA